MGAPTSCDCEKWSSARFSNLSGRPGTIRRSSLDTQTRFRVPRSARRRLLSARHCSVGHRPSLAQGRPAACPRRRLPDRRPGRRLTPTSNDTPLTSFLLFFGGSNTFGQGLGQTETLPYYAGELSSGYRPYNYAVPGYGPAQLLGLLNQERLRKEVAERDGYAVFFLIPAHVGRVVGSSQVSTGWGRHFGHYTLDDRGSFVAHGDFVHGRPFTTLAYFFWSKSNLAERFGVALPWRYTADDYRLTAKLLAESGHQVARQLHLRGFYALLGPPSNDAELGVNRLLHEALVGEQVKVLDYTGLFDRREARYRLSELDRHHSALGEPRDGRAARLRPRHQEVSWT